MQILGIASPVSDTESARWKVHVWAVLAAQSRPGTRKLHERNVSDVKLFTFDADTLRWPHGRSA